MSVIKMCAAPVVGRFSNPGAPRGAGNSMRLTHRVPVAGRGADSATGRPRLQARALARARETRRIADVAEIADILQLANIGGHFANQRIAIASLRRHCLKPPFRSPDTAAERRPPDVAEISNIGQLADIVALLRINGLRLRRRGDSATKRRARVGTVPRGFRVTAETVPQPCRRC